jgi:hypothetical protein
VGAGPWGRTLAALAPEGLTPAGLAALGLWTGFMAAGRREVVALVSTRVMEGSVMVFLVRNGVGMDGLGIDRAETGTKGRNGGLLLIRVHGGRPQPRWSVRYSVLCRPVARRPAQLSCALLGSELMPMELMPFGLVL